MNALRLTTLLAVAALGLVAVAAPAAAHASMNTADGKYRITWGLLDEPGFTFVKNKLDLIIRELPTPGSNATGAGVNGLTAANLTVQLRYLDQTYELGNITQNVGVKGASFAGSVAPNGNYTSANAVMLTQPGIYTLAIRGDIRGSPVDLTIPAAHDYEAIQEIMFPAEVEIGGGADVAALEARIAALEAKIATQAATPATVIPQSPGGTPPGATQSGTPSEGGSPIPGLGMLLAALAAVGAALLLRRRR